MQASCDHARAGLQDREAQLRQLQAVVAEAQQQLATERSERAAAKADMSKEVSLENPGAEHLSKMSLRYERLMNDKSSPCCADG